MAEAGGRRYLDLRATEVVDSPDRPSSLIVRTDMETGEVTVETGD